MSKAKQRKENAGQRAFRQRILSKQAVKGSGREHCLDLVLDCPAKGCGAGAGQECRGLDSGIVHFGRRLLRLLRGIRSCHQHV